jgi:hypothetical protein
MLVLNGDDIRRLVTIADLAAAEFIATRAVDRKCGIEVAWH